MDHDDKLTGKIVVLENWKRLLRQSPAIARAKAQAVLASLAASKLHSHYDLMRFHAQMMNGTATPEDFTGGISAAHSIASS